MLDNAEVLGLLALMLLNDARRGARVDAAGAYVALGKQDRAAWATSKIEEGLRILEAAQRLRRPGAYQLEAAITAVHMRGKSDADTDWEEIARLYTVLAETKPSLVVDVNRAVAVGFALGAQAGLDILEPLLADSRMRDYQPLHAAHAELLRRAENYVGAEAAYKRAIELSTNDVERAELERRLDELSRK